MAVLKPIEREFINNVVYQGLPRVEAYAMAMGEQEKLEDPDEVAKMRTKANQMIMRKNVYEYYVALQDEVRQYETQKSAWTKERATEALVKLVEKVEKELYEDNANASMSRINGIVLPIKELNLMHGLSTPTNNINTQMLVQIVGEDKIPD